MKDRLDELAEIWLEKAKNDVLWVEHNLQGGFFGMVCFGCQQIVEKALKAYLFSQREKLVKTHNLIGLLRRCRQHNSSFKRLIRACETLNAYYTDTRYPDIWDITRFEDEKLAKEALKLAREVLEFVKKRIPS